MKKNRLVQKLIISLACLLMIFLNTRTSTNLVYAAPVNNPKLQSMPLNTNFTKEKNNFNSLSLMPQLNVSEHKLGLVQAPFKLPKVKSNKIAKDVLYPVTYDLRSLGKVTSIKNQLSSGSCWDFATYSSLESSLLPSENRDFSENNLKNNSGFDYGVNDGGNELMSTAYLARWDGPINESDDPYNPNSTVSPTNLTTQKHIQEVLWLPDRVSSTDNNTIKDSIMKNGAIYSTLNYEEFYFNKKYNTYYDFDQFYGSNNHAVSIVGWDDQYDKNKFKNSSTGQVPAGNGAFIVRNSWGTAWGDKGYFYVSYYDENIGIDNAVFNGVEPTTNYANIYQYDPLGLVTFIGNADEGDKSSWFSNVFTASSSENLSAVSFYTAIPNTSYEVYVCSNYNDPSDLATARVLKKSGFISVPGYHTIALSSVAPITKGKKFGVIVKVTTSELGYEIPVEDSIAGYSSSATASAGQSFYSSSGSTWSDLTTDYDTSANVCLKAFTQSVITGLVTFNSQGGSVVSAISAYANKVMIAPASPTRSGYTFIGWYKEADCLNAWNFLTDTVTSNTTLYAKWEIKISVTYQAHVQNIGWQNFVSDGNEAGTDGKSLRVEALKIKLVNAPEGAIIKYQAHVQKLGWQNWVNSGQEAGTDGKSLRVEAVKISLVNMPGYCVQYQAHVQNIGWQAWVSDGKEAGTDGKSLRVEAIRIRIVKN